MNTYWSPFVWWLCAIAVQSLAWSICCVSAWIVHFSCSFTDSRLGSWHPLLLENCLLFFFFLISRNQELWKKSAEMFSARIEKYQLTFSAFPYPTDHPVNQTEKVLGFLYLVYCYLHNPIYDSWGMANELRLPLLLKCWHLSVTRIDGQKATRAVNMQFMV